MDRMIVQWLMYCNDLAYENVVSDSKQRFSEL